MSAVCVCVGGGGGGEYLLQCVLLKTRTAPRECDEGSQTGN